MLTKNKKEGFRAIVGVVMALMVLLIAASILSIAIEGVYVNEYNTTPSNKILNKAFFSAPICVVILIFNIYLRRKLRNNDEGR